MNLYLWMIKSNIFTSVYSQNLNMYVLWIYIYIYGHICIHISDMYGWFFFVFFIFIFYTYGCTYYVKWNTKSAPIIHGQPAYNLHLAYDMGLHYLTFMGRNAENKKKLMPVWRMNSGGLSNKDIVHNVGIFDDSTSINNKYMEIMLRWRVIHVLVKGIRLHPIFEVQLEYTNSKQILLVYSRNPQNIFQGHGTDPHDWIMLCGSSICSNSKMQSCINPCGI